MTFWKIFLESIRVRRKHAKKSRVGLWGQSMILQAIEANCRVLRKDYL